jgi:hypothetical protein
MRLLLLLIYLSLSAAAQYTTVADSFRDPQGRPLSGTITLTPDAQFVSGANRILPRPITVTVKSDGSFSVALLPTDTANPPGRYYTAAYSVGKISWTGTWQVPTAAVPLAIEDVEQAVPPATNALGYTDWRLGAAPTENPSAGTIRVYGKTGGGVCWKDSSGTEVCAGGAGTWGGITGTLSEQADLQAALDAKAAAAHAARHATGQADAITPAAIGAQAALGFTPENAANKGQAGGYAGLDAGSRVTKTNAPAATAYTDASNTYGAGTTQTFTGALVATGSDRTAPAKSGTALPASCSVGDQYFKTDAAAGQNLYFCTGVNTWTQMSGGTGAGDVVGPPASTDTAIPVFDGVTGKVLKNGLCTQDVNGKLTCPGGYGGGDGTAPSGIVLPELTANGTNDFRIYGAQDQAADGCIVVAGAVGDDQVLKGTATTVTIDGKTCRVMAAEADATGGAGEEPTAISGTGGGYFFPFGPTADDTESFSYYYASRLPFIFQFTLPAKATISKIRYRVVTGGTFGVQFAIWAANSNGTVGARLAQSSVTQNSTSGSNSVVQFLPSGITLPSGTYFLSISTDSGSIALRQTNTFWGGSPDTRAMLNLTAPRIGTCANAATGTGGSIAHPATCGVVDPDHSILPPFVVLE